MGRWWGLKALKNKIWILPSCFVPPNYDDFSAQKFGPVNTTRWVSCSFGSTSVSTSWILARSFRDIWDGAWFFVLTILQDCWIDCWCNIFVLGATAWHKIGLSSFAVKEKNRDLTFEIVDIVRKCPQDPSASTFSYGRRFCKRLALMGSSREKYATFRSATRVDVPDLIPHLGFWALFSKSQDFNTWVTFQLGVASAEVHKRYWEMFARDEGYVSWSRGAMFAGWWGHLDCCWWR